MFRVGFCLLFVACAEQNDSEILSCEVDEDCPVMHVVWTPACDGDVLQTPTGSGESACDQQECVLDIEIVEMDCTLSEQVCGVDDNGQAGCVDP